MTGSLYSKAAFILSLNLLDWFLNPENLFVLFPAGRKNLKPARAGALGPVFEATKGSSFLLINCQNQNGRARLLQLRESAFYDQSGAGRSMRKKPVSLSQSAVKTGDYAKAPAKLAGFLPESAKEGISDSTYFSMSEQAERKKRLKEPQSYRDTKISEMKIV